MSVFPSWPMLALAVLALVGIVWLARSRPSDRATTARRVGIAVLLIMVSLRPAVGVGDQAAQASNLDVVLVIDTTSSMGAPDWGTGQPRLDGVRSDVRELLPQLAGARFAMITFANTAQVEIPLTSDATAVQTGVDTLVVMPPTYGKGSDLDVVTPVLADVLTAAAQTDPDRERYVLYFGDGEQTVARPAAGFAGFTAPHAGATVLGYGTVIGARVPNGYGGWVYDRTTNEDAVSRIDETLLQTMAANLTGDYRHRTTAGGLDDLLAGQRLRLTATPDRVPAAAETYWAFGFGLAGLALWELWVQAMAYRVTRRELR